MEGRAAPQTTAGSAGLARPGLAILVVIVAMCTTAAGAQNQDLSPRQPLIDAVAREEIDGYRRLDEVMARAAELPDVFDSGIYAAGATTTELRGRILGYLLWLQGAESSHLERIESLPGRLALIDTREPYRDEFIEVYRASTPERYRRIGDFYRGEIAAANQRLGFLDFLDSHRIRTEAGGFVFSNGDEVGVYRDLVSQMNATSATQDLAVSDYYAWEIRQKSSLRHFRDQL
jgi:hypothetical protein